MIATVAPEWDREKLGCRSAVRVVRDGVMSTFVPGVLLRTLRYLTARPHGGMHFGYVGHSLRRDQVGTGDAGRRFKAQLLSRAGAEAQQGLQHLCGRSWDTYRARRKHTASAGPWQLRYKAQLGHAPLLPRQGTVRETPCPTPAVALAPPPGPERDARDPAQRSSVARRLDETRGATGTIPHQNLKAAKQFSRRQLRRIVRMHCIA